MINGILIALDSNMKEKIIKGVLNDIQDILQKKRMTFKIDRTDDINIFSVIDGGTIEYLNISVDINRQILILSSKIKGAIETSIREEFAVLISVVNNLLFDGSYDFDLDSGELYYRLTTSCMTREIIEDKLMIATELTGCGYNIIADFISGKDSFSASISRVIKSKTENFTKQDIEKTKKVFHCLELFIKSIGWRYKKYSEDLRIGFDVLGEDVPMSFDISVDSDKEMIILDSIQPFITRSKKREKLALATCIVSNILIDGSFSYNWTEDRIVFRMTTSYKDDSVDNDVLIYIVTCALNTVEQFNDKFLDLNKGNISLKNFIECIKNEYI